MIAQARSEHHLRIVTRRPIAVQGVVADQVGTPLHPAGIHIDEQRRVCRHHHHVAVPFQAGQERGVAQGGAEVGSRRAFAGGPFADEDLRAVAVGVVVVARFLEHSLLALVVVVIHDIGSHAFHRHGGDHLEVWVLRLDCLVELSIPAVVSPGAVEIVFVADLHVAQGERRRMPVARAHRAPLGVGSAGDVLDLLQPLLYVGFQVRPRLHHLPAERVPGIDAQQRLHVQVLAPFQEFQQSHAVGGVVAPRGGVRRTVDQRADHLLPIEAGLDPVAFQVVSPGKAQERADAWPPASP